MPRLSSPDPTIDQLLASSLLLQQALQKFIDEGKFVPRRILPGFWQKFLDSPHGSKWRDVTPEPDDIPDPIVPTPPKYTCMNGFCLNLVFCTDCSMCAVHCGCTAHEKTLEVLDVICEQCGRLFPTNAGAKRCLVCLRGTPPSPPQDDLFELIARGVQDRLKPQAVTLDEDRVQALIYKAMADERAKHRYTIVTRSADDKQMRVTPSDLPLPRWFDRVYKLARSRVHVLLVGPRGCGKTMTGELLATALDLPLYTVSLSAGVSEGVLQGWLHPSKAGLLFEYNRSRFVKAYTEGGVVLLDELDAADSNMLMILNAALANGKWEIPLRGEAAEALVKHPDFICIAAANTRGHGADRVYVGRNQLDGATLDRFAMGRLSLDYDEAMECAAYDKATVTFGQRLRARCRAQKGWTRDVSTRNIADSCKAQQELTLEESWYSFFEDWNDGDCEKVGAIRKRDSMSVTLE